MITRIYGIGFKILEQFYDSVLEWNKIFKLNFILRYIWNDLKYRSSKKSYLMITFIFKNPDFMNAVLIRAFKSKLFEVFFEQNVL